MQLKCPPVSWDLYEQQRLQNANIDIQVASEGVNLLTSPQIKASSFSAITSEANEGIFV